MDYNLLSIIKKEKENVLEDKNDNYSRLSCDVHAKVENGFDDCLQNSVLLNDQQETFNYDNFKEEKHSCSICSENFINSYSLYKHNLIHLKVPLERRKLFICVVCSNFYETNKELQNHITAAHEDKTLYTVLSVQCPKCPKIFKCKSYLTRHLRNCHREGTFQCKICKSVKKSKQYLLNHMRSMHDDDGRLHHCDICGKSFKSPSKLKRHKKYCHTYRERITVQCPKCPKILNKSSLTTHLKSCHSEGTFQCKICESVLKSEPSLVAHMRMVHDDDGMLHHCDICGKSFKSPSKVKKHKKYSHTYRERITIQCPKCPKIFNRKNAFTAHLKNSHSEATFECKICKSVLKNEPSLVSHMKEVHYDDGMLHHCEICGKGFKSPSKVKRHEKYSHTYQERLSGTIQCPKCSQILNTSALTTHLKQCHSEEMFQCEICKSVLKSKRYLSTHMRMVHDDDGMLHSCDICGKSFKWALAVTTHKKKFHTYQEGSMSKILENIKQEKILDGTFKELSQ